MNEFDDLNDLDDVFGPLRSSARSAELSQERATVDLMVNAHRTSEGKHMFTSRSARIATLVAAGVLGFGGMAAASPSLGGDGLPVIQQLIADDTDETDEAIRDEVDTKVDTDEVDTEKVDTDEIDTDEVDTDEVDTDESKPVEEVEVAEAEIADPDAEVLPADGADSDDDKETWFNEDNCADGNHGKTVSAVARGDLDFLAKYAEDNDGDVPTVTDAAHSSCGKTDRDSDDTGTEPEFEEPVVEESESVIEEPVIEDSEVDEKVEETRKSDVKAERPGKGADGPGNGKANGNGKSNGKRGG